MSVFRAAGVLAGVVAAWVAVRSGTGVLLAVPLLSTGIVAGVLLGELFAPRPGGAVRRASLRVRRVTDYLPPAPATVAGCASLLLLGVSTGTTSLAGHGRLLECGGAAVGPFPGAYSTVPTGAVVGGGLLLAALTLRRVTRRPWLDDDAARRRSARTVTAASGVLVSAPLAAVSVSGGWALHRLADTCGHSWWTAAGQGLLVLAALAVLALGWFGAALLIPPTAPTAAGTVPAVAAR
ncbi:hypothetical protein [Dactylosporangium sp. NPDC005555]|uniref:hypothetical protein n=1 Tax=Dactylosporangium sp. NPDC005555 TaxID=3154889 RepID=UPI00339ED2DE